MAHVPIGYRKHDCSSGLHFFLSLLRIRRETFREHFADTFDDIRSKHRSAAGLVCLERAVITSRSLRNDAI